MRCKGSAISQDRDLCSDEVSLHAGSATGSLESTQAVIDPATIKPEPQPSEDEGSEPHSDASNDEDDDGELEYIPEDSPHKSTRISGRAAPKRGRKVSLFAC